MKRDRLDALFSLYIRTRDRFTCQRCGASYPPKHTGLHAAHIIGRGRISVRWHSPNAITLCYGCHRWLDTHPDVKEQWVRMRFGDAAYDDLQVHARATVKVDRQAVRDWLTKSLRDLDA